MLPKTPMRALTTSTSRLRRAATIAVLAAVTLLASAGATAKVLVSNDFSGLTITQIFLARWAQRFTTGNERTTLTAVQISAPSAHAFDTEIYTVNSSGVLHTRIARLNRPSSFGGANIFTAPANTVLEPNTEYALSIRRPGSPTPTLTLNTIAEDADYGEDGWSIRNTYTYWNNFAWIDSSGGQSLKIELTGETYVPPAPPNLRAHPGFDKAILDWDRPSGLRDHDGYLGRYQYQQKPDGGTWSEWRYTHRDWPSGTGLVVRGLTNGTSYSFRVRGMYQTGEYLNVFTAGRESNIATTTPAPQFRLGVSSNGFREGSSEGVRATISITDGYVLDAPQTFDLEWLGAAVAGTYYMHDDNPTTITLPAGSIHASVVLRAKHTGSPDYVVPVESELVAKYHGNVIGRQPLTCTTTTRNPS